MKMPAWPSGLIRPWHGCLDHNRNHCPGCRTCDCHAARPDDDQEVD